MPNDLSPKTCDLGLEKILGSTNSKNNTVVEKTFIFQVPEMFCWNSSYKTKTDIWALGALPKGIIIDRQGIGIGEREKS